jgi:hypothetical protein
MSSSSARFSELAPWRRAVTVALYVVAVAVLVLAVSGVIHTAAIAGAAVVVALSYLVGPRSPFFHADAD